MEEFEKDYTKHTIASLLFYFQTGNLPRTPVIKPIPVIPNDKGKVRDNTSVATPITPINNN